MSSKKAKTKTTKKRPQRATSNVFAMFDQSQIQEFKEAFNMIDQNRDGFIDKEDLHDMLASLGKNPTDAYLDAMMNEAPGPINFTMFLTMFGEKLNGTDPEDVIRNAFACFDEEATGGEPRVLGSRSKKRAEPIHNQVKYSVSLSAQVRLQGILGKWSKDFWGLKSWIQVHFYTRRNCEKPYSEGSI
uniref:Myosin light chain 12B n=1 Tax=Monodelphis domestica TaxID=13616 RepID=A0A5F8G6K0_MONDO